MSSTQETAEGSSYVLPEAEPGSYTVEIKAREFAHSRTLPER